MIRNINREQILDIIYQDVDPQQCDVMCETPGRFSNCSDFNIFSFVDILLSSEESEHPCFR